jgi:holliday junction DNA helicase RuvA
MSMFAYIRGSVVHLEESRLVILPEGMGLGLEVLVDALTLSKARMGEILELHLHHHITDVSEVLFGFGSIEEKLLFRKLLKVDGVGGKTALSLLNLGKSILIRAIEEGDEKILSGANGVGKKTALKIIVELKKELSSDILFKDDISQSPLAPSHSTEITDTLISMGYERRQVEKIIQNIPPDLTELQDKVIWSIRQLAGK